MRFCLSLVLLALLGLPTSGCFVMDELDSGAAEMGRYSGDPPDAEDAEPTPRNPNTYRAPEPVAEKGPDWKEYVPDVGEWWKKARSINAQERDERIVHCRIGTHELFMDAKQCRARGGTTS